MSIMPSGLFPQTPETIFLSGYPYFGIYEDSLLITVISGIYGSNIKIFESNTDTFVYRLGAILRLNESDIFERVAADVSTLAETSENIFVTVSNSVYTKNATVKSAIHNAPFVSGWSNEGVLSGYIARASISDNTYFRDIPTLVGNTLVNTFPRIVRNDLNARPFGGFPKSDAGIPQTTSIGQITVLEAV